jgi:hypothetical protein
MLLEPARARVSDRDRHTTHTTIACTHSAIALTTRAGTHQFGLFNGTLNASIFNRPLSDVR